MSIKDVLVSFCGTDSSSRAVRLAAAVARRFDAHVTGVFAHAAPYTHVQLDGYLTQSSLDIMAQAARETELRYEEEFNDIVAAEEQGLRTSFISAQGFPNDVLARLGRVHDLIVIGQPNKNSSVYQDAFPDDLAMRSGRPVMVAPKGYENFELAGGAMLAWDGERAASRALADAMDLLEDQHRVKVLHVGDEKEIRQPGQDILRHLSRHGIDAELDVQPRGGLGTSDIILNACAESDVGLLVMGAYEHSRFSEMILGGVTRDIVQKSHIPVLLSH